MTVRWSTRVIDVCGEVGGQLPARPFQRPL